MFCIGCGGRLKESDTFCQSCGAPAKPSPANPRPNTGESKTVAPAAPAQAPATPATPLQHAQSPAAVGTPPAAPSPLPIQPVPMPPVSQPYVSSPPVPEPVTSSAQPHMTPAGWVILVAVALVFGFVLVSGRMSGNASPSSSDSVSSSDSYDSVADDGESEGTSTEQQSYDITDQATTMKASKTLRGYPASNLTDGKPNTAWAEGVKDGYGEGEYVRFAFDSEVTITGIRIIPGYVKYDSKNGVDRWYSNGRVSAAHLVFSDGTVSPTFYPDADNKEWQEFYLDEPVRATGVKFVIDATAPAQTGTKHDASDTSIAEMRILGVTQ